jgi:hypothetical protein
MDCSSVVDSVKLVGAASMAEMKVVRRRGSKEIILLTAGMERCLRQGCWHLRIALNQNA